MNNIRISEYSSFSSQGIRENNEDCIYPESFTGSGSVFVVCDGVGGLEHGEVASRLVSGSVGDFLNLQSELTPGLLQQAADKAVEVLNDNEIGQDKQKMGTTLVVCAIRENDVLVGHAGDSRLYLLRPSEGIVFRTKDHSMVQEWLDAEVISEEESRTHPEKNVITRCLTPRPEKPVVIETDLLTDIRTGDYLFLCTDGVTEAVADAELSSVILSSGPVEKKAADIIRQCDEKSTDNFSFILIQLQGNTDMSPKQPEVTARKCRRCGKDIPLQAYHCPSCGLKIGLDFTTDYFERVTVMEDPCSSCGWRRICHLFHWSAATGCPKNRKSKHNKNIQ